MIILFLLEHLDGKWINPQDDNEAIVWVPADIEVINELKKRS